MKMNKKKLAVISLVLCVAAILSMASLAWFTADDSIVNTLTMYDESAFVVDVFEHDAKGKEVGADSTTGLTYDDLMPSEIIDKDPTVRNKSSHDQWVRAKISVSNADAWDAALGEATIDSIFTDINTTEWTVSENGWAKENGVYYCYYYLNSALAPYAKKTKAPTSVLFEHVQMPETIDNTTSAALAGTTITVDVEAIQKEGFDSCAAAFEAVNPEVTE